MELKSLVELTKNELKEIVCNHFKLDKEKTEIRVSGNLNDSQKEELKESQKTAINNSLANQMTDKSVNDSINTR